MTDDARKIVDRLLFQLANSRRALAEIKALAHPPIVDHLGREWTWISHDTYRHDDMAFPREWVTDGESQWPLAVILDNPNYAWCDHCLKGIQGE